MEILIDREADLIFSWHPGCMFQGIDQHGQSIYVLGEIGRRGPGVTDLDIKKQIENWEKPSVPSSLQFNIRLKNKTDEQLYKEILEVLIEHASNNSGQIKVTVNAPRKIREKGCVKEEFKDKLNEANQKNNEIREKFLSLINQLGVLGCMCDDLGQPRYEKILDEWFEWNEYIDASYGSFSICCHSETHFYKFMQEKGIFDKYFPEWYAKGEF